jgi:hypothetical protein
MVDKGLLDEHASLFRAVTGEALSVAAPSRRTKAALATFLEGDPSVAWLVRTHD